MATILTVRDETTGSAATREWSLEVTAESMSIRELIRSRVYQEVQDYNTEHGRVFQGLVQPDEAEQALNGWKLKKPRQLDWKRQFARAIEAFESNRILILVNDHQAKSLDDEFIIDPRTKVIFLRLNLLVGGWTGVEVQFLRRSAC
jgi:hypothetical protein